MPGFDGGMFNLGFGNPVPPNEDPNTSEVQRLVADLEMRILDGLMEQIKQPAGLISEVDNQVFDNLNSVSQPIVDNITFVDNKLSNDVGSKVEILSARVGPLNRLAQKVGINLTEQANEVVSVKADEERKDLVNGIREAFGQFLKPSDQSEPVVGSQPQTNPKPSPFKAKGTSTSLGVDATRGEPLIIPPYIFPVLDEHNITPGDVENIHIWPDGAVHVDHTGGVVLFENPGDWPKPPPRPKPSPLPPQDEPQGDDPIPIPGVTGETPIEIVQELPTGEEVPTSPPGSTVPIPQEGDCPDATVRCGDCNCGPCVCPTPPVISTPPTDTGYETPTGPVDTIAETVSPVVNVLNTIELPEPKEEEPKKIYIAYCNQSSGQIIVRELGQPVTGTNLKPVSASENPQAAMINAQAVCRGREPYRRSEGSQLIAPDLLGLCGRDSYAAGQTALHIFDGVISNSPIGALFGLGGTTRKEGFIRFLSDMADWNPVTLPLSITLRFVTAFVELLDANLARFLQSYAGAGIEFSSAMIGRIVIGILESWVSADFGKFKQPFVYKSDATLPSLFPSADQATNAYITGAIDKSTWELWVQMNNYCSDPYEVNVEVGRSKFAPLTLLDMKRRDLVTSSEYLEEFRNLGYTRTTDPYRFEEVSKFIPPIQDLIRFMVRDTFDDSVVKSLKLDDEFPKKWIGQAPIWGKYQGVDDEVAKQYWMAHWQIPSSGQLYDIYHRNRVEHPPDEDPFDIDKLEETLKINDNLPSLIPYLIQASEHLLTRVDIRRAFRLGVIEEPEVEDNYKMRGYSDKNAATMVQYAQSDKDEFLLGRREVKLFRDGLLSEAEFRNFMAKYKPAPDALNYIVEITNKERKAPIIKRCLKSLEKQYLDRDLDDDALQVKLDELKVPKAVQDNFKEELECLIVSEDKKLTANQLCALYGGGQLNGPQLLDRLEELGYEPAQAIEMKMLCDWKIDAKNAKINQKALEAADRERKRLAREQAKALAKQERAEARTEKMREKRKLANDRRQIRLLKVTNKLAKCNGVQTEVAGNLIRNAMVAMSQLYPFTAEERVSIMERTVEKCQPKTAEEFNDQWIRLAMEFDRIQGPLGQ
jgi:hypothetical protein